MHIVDEEEEEEEEDEEEDEELGVEISLLCEMR